jgi:CBS-domain-containing membrane protein
MTVRDVMTTSVITVQDETPLKEVARLLVEHGISGLPVRDTHGRVVGVVSEADFLMKETGPDALPHRPLARVLGDSRQTQAWRAKIDATTAEEAMSAPAITVNPSATIAEAARLMTEKKVNRLVVIEDDRLLGIVTRADLVRAYVRSDEELAETIRSEVLLRILWLDPAAFRVTVTRGVATVSGHVDRRSTSEIVASSIAMIPGIVGVNADITWSRDDAEIRPAMVDPVFPFSPR